MGIDLGGCAGVEVLEEVGETVGGRRGRVDFGREGFEESARQSVRHCMNGNSGPLLPLRQAPYFDGELLEAFGHVDFLLGRLIVGILVGSKDITVCMSLFLVLGRGGDLQGVGDGRHWRALEGACPAAGEGVLWLGRLETRERLGGVEAGGSLGHGWARGSQDGRRRCGGGDAVMVCTRA